MLSTNIKSTRCNNHLNNMNDLQKVLKLKTQQKLRKKQWIKGSVCLCIHWIKLLSSYSLSEYLSIVFHCNGCVILYTKSQCLMKQIVYSLKHWYWISLLKSIKIGHKFPRIIDGTVSKSIALVTWLSVH